MSQSLWLVVAIVFLCVIAALLYFFAPAWATRPPREIGERFVAEDRYRQTLFAAIGGLAVLLTFAWTFQKDRETLQQSADQEANRQYLEAAKMLSGEGGVSTKAAAIFALGNLAATQPSLYSPIRETIASFITSETGLDGTSLDENFSLPVVDSAVRAAITVLGRRDMSQEDARWPLSLDGVVVNGANFHHLQSFRGSSFQGAHMQGDDFRCADLDGAVFDGATMSDYLSFRNWNDNQVDAAQWEDWRKYRFIVNFEGASLRGAHFRGVDLAGASFVNADLDNADFSGANLSRVDFAGARNISTVRFSDGDDKRACADMSARFDGKPVMLPACKIGKPFRTYHFSPVAKHISVSSDPVKCRPQARR